MRLLPVVTVPVLFLWFSAAAAPEVTSRAIRPEASAMPEATQSVPTFGSQTVLERCWSSEELEGSGSQAPPLPATAPDGRAAPQWLAPPLFPQLRQSIRSVSTPDAQKLLALTFDLCESSGKASGYDAEVVNALRKHNVRATFFAGGKWMRSHPEKTMQLMADPLFEVGNHSWTHANFCRLDRKGMEEQILRTQAEYETLRGELATRPCTGGVPPSEVDKIPRTLAVFRFPYGTCNQEALDLLAGYGLPAIQWSIVSGDPDPHQTAQGIAQILLRQVHPGAIIICHANERGHGTAAALPLFIPKLRALGYEFVTISELLSSGRPIAASTCYEQQPGDNAHVTDLTRKPRHETP